MSGSRDGFLMSGVTIDNLNTSGKDPVARELLMMLVIVGARTDKHFLSRPVGIGSRSHCLSGADFTSFTISSMVAGSNKCKTEGGEGGLIECGSDDVAGIFDRNLLTLSEKKVANDCANVDESVDGTGLVGFRCRIEFIVCHSLRGFREFVATKLE